MNDKTPLDPEQMKVVAETLQRNLKTASDTYMKAFENLFKNISAQIQPMAKAVQKMASKIRRPDAECEAHGSKQCFFCALNPSWCAPWLSQSHYSIDGCSSDTPNGYRYTGMHIARCPNRLDTVQLMVDHTQRMLDGYTANSVGTHGFAANWEGEGVDSIWFHAPDDPGGKGLWHLRSYDYAHDNDPENPETCLQSVQLAKILVNQQLHVEPIWTTWINTMRTWAPTYLPNDRHPIYMDWEERQETKPQAPSNVQVVTGAQDGVALCLTEAMWLPGTIVAPKTPQQTDPLGTMMYHMPSGIIHTKQQSENGMFNGYLPWAIVTETKSTHEKSLVAGEYAWLQGTQQDVCDQLFKFLERMTYVENGERKIHGGTNELRFVYYNPSMDYGEIVVIKTDGRYSARMHHQEDKASGRIVTTATDMYGKPEGFAPLQVRKDFLNVRDVMERSMNDLTMSDLNRIRQEINRDDRWSIAVTNPVTTSDNSIIERIKGLRAWQRNS